MFLKTVNTEFDEIIITFMDQNCRPLINNCLSINKNDMLFYRTNKKNMNFCHSREIYQTNTENDYWILL